MQLEGLVGEAGAAEGRGAVAWWEARAVRGGCRYWVSVCSKQLECYSGVPRLLKDSSLSSGK